VLNISRRELMAGAGAFALLAAGGIAKFPWSDLLTTAAHAQSAGKSVSMTDLLAPGPLPEHSVGAADAPVTIVAYASLTCPHCAHFENTTYPDLKKKYIDAGKVRYVFREFVLNKLDATAMLVARCVPGDRYIPFVETLYQMQDQWAVQDGAIPKLKNIAKQAGITDEQFNKCAVDQAMLDNIVKQRDIGGKFGVDSTPTFFINGTLYNGDMPFDRLEKLITPLLKA
jgi:protein-disulfide isomerase